MTTTTSYIDPTFYWLIELSLTKLKIFKGIPGTSSISIIDEF